MKIDPEFRALIAPMHPAEREQLESNLVANGCRDPLVVWHDTLIDGHNRHEICTRRGVKFRTVEVALASREHVLLWIEENQLGRRNLSDDQRAVIVRSVIKRQSDLEKKLRAQAARARGGDATPAQKKERLSATATDKRSQPKPKKDTRKAVSKRAKVSERKVRAVEAIAKKRPEALEAIRSGEKTIQEVNTEIRRKERTEKIVAMAQPGPWPTERFPVIYADPPWRYDFAETENRAIENQYPTMTLAEICALKVAELATPDAVLFLWAPGPKLVEAMEVIRAWGFEYRTSIIWVKDSPGMGYYVREQHELVLCAERGAGVPAMRFAEYELQLVAKRGGPPVPEPGMRPPSVIYAPRQEHSAKPPIVYQLLERMYPAFPRIELFARSTRDGWTAWGNQSEAVNA
jgi:N6-adenosine-specific RNA methylase IME4